MPNHFGFGSPTFALITHDSKYQGGYCYWSPSWETGAGAELALQDLLVGYHYL